MKFHVMSEENQLLGHRETKKENDLKGIYIL